MSLSSVAPFLIIIVAVIVGDILCGDVTNIRQPINSNPWSQTGNNKDTSSIPPQWDPNSTSTTPWPALGQRRNQQQNTRNQPMWVRPNNGVNWIRNTPPPNTQNNGLNVQSTVQGGNNGVLKPNSGKAASNFNTQFLNNERGGLNPNQGSGMKVNVNQNVNTNTMRGTVSLGPMSPNLPNQSPNNGNSNGLGIGGPMMTVNMRGTSPTGPMIGVGGPSPGMPNQNSNSGMRGSGPIGSMGALGGLNPTLPVNGNNQNINQKPSNNNGMTATIPTGSMNAGTGTSSQNQGSDGSRTGGDIGDNDLREFSEQLLAKDTNNAARYVKINIQGMTTSRSTNDEAPLPLLSIDQAAYSLPTIEKLMLLYNNYILEANQNEVYTAQEKIEENNLLDTILSTPVMQFTRNFLVQNGKIGKDPKEFRDLLRQIWFNMYSRGRGRIGSSGFEHVFLAELKNNQVSGLHNWVYFNEEESKKNANYLGYLKKIDLGNKGAILKYHFNFHGVDKPVGSMFIGTSPELEIALYSACFILRADRICPLKMNGNRFIIRTYTYRYRGKDMIGSAFPEI